jgi:hypothetical protein
VSGDSLKPAEMNGSGSTRRPAPYDRVGRERLLLALILSVAAAVRLIGIGQSSFGTDEISELRIAHSSLSTILTFGDGIPPLYNLLVHFLLPLGDLAGRVFSALVGVATVGVTWVWVRRIAGAPACTWAAWLMALSPFAIAMSRENRANALMALLIAASLWSLWAALDDPSPLRWARWGLVTALGVYAHYMVAIVVVAGLVVALIDVRGRPRRDMWLGIGTLGMLAAPALALLPGDLTAQLTIAGVGINPSRAAHAAYTLIAGFSLGPSLRDLLGFSVVEAIKSVWVWVAVLAPPVGLLLVEGWRALGSITRRRLIALSVTGLLVELAAIHVSGQGLPTNYTAWLLFPLCVWLAAGLAHLRRHWRWASVALLLTAGVCSIVLQNLDPHHQTDDARGVAAYLQSSGALDHPVLVSSDGRVRPILYYIDRPLSLTLPDQWDPKRGRLDYYSEEQLGLVGLPGLGTSSLSDVVGVVDAVAEPGEPYYLVYTEPFYCDRHGELLAALTTRDGLTLVQEFAGMDVYRGVRAA